MQYYILMANDSERDALNEANLLGEIIHESGAVGEFKLGNLKITISQMNEYQNQLIYNE